MISTDTSLRRDAKQSPRFCRFVDFVETGLGKALGTECRPDKIRVWNLDFHPFERLCLGSREGLCYFVLLAI